MNMKSVAIEAHGGTRRAFIEGTLRVAWIPTSLLIIAFAAFWPYRHFAGDDAYITFRFVRNVASGAGYAYNAGEPTYGSTAPLWVYLIVAVHSWGLSVPDAAHALNWVFSLSAVLAFYRLSGYYVERPLLRSLATLLLVFNPWFLRWAMSGMENSLALTLWEVAVLCRLRCRASGRDDWFSPACAALATLTRPEMIMLAGLVLADMLLAGGARRFQQIARGCAIYLAIVVPWAVYAQATFGTIVPNTIRAKLSPQHLEAALQTLRFFASFWVFQATALGLALWLRRKGGDEAPAGGVRGRWLLPVAWGFALPLFYVVGGANVSGRYLVYGVPSYLLIGTRAWEHLFALGRASLAWVATATAAATAVLIGFVHYKYCWFITKWPEGMDPRMIEAARFLHDHSSPGDAVACDQIGVMGYFSERYVLDPLGLVSPETLPYRRSKDQNAIWRYVRERAPEFLFLTDDVSTMAARDPAYGSAELLYEIRVHREGATGGDDAGTLMRLYRTHWPTDKADSTRASLHGVAAAGREP
jgi:hypothetical protein